MLRILGLAAAVSFFSGSAWAFALIPGAPSASPNYFDFSGPGTTFERSFTFELNNGNQVTATGTTLWLPSKVSQTESGLGVKGPFEPDEVGVGQKLDLKFDHTFNLAHIALGDLTKGFKTDTGVVKLIRDDSVLKSIRFDAGLAKNEMLTIAFAEGVLVDHLEFYVPLKKPLSNFAVLGISEVPIPAALPLLATALSGLVWVRRRRQAS